MAAASPRSSSEPDTAEHSSSELTQGSRGQRDETQRDPEPPGVDPTRVDANTEPSAEWGWHGEFPRATEFAGWFTAVALLFMIIGNHESNIENLWLIALGGGLILMLIGGRLANRGPWRR